MRLPRPGPAITLRRLVGPAALMLALLCFAFAMLAWTRPLAPIARPDPASFEADLVRHGARLASLGDCLGCHTVPGDPPFAGGVALATPFGTVYSTNVTPDAPTGIGTWSEGAFVRAMRQGVARDGRHLYPAFPYDHFTKLATPDLRALYAFLMTREPYARQQPSNELAFPFGWRPLLALWKLLFLDPRPWTPDPKRTDEQNQGAYLVEALAHCGACHTPRNALGAERRGRAFDGGVIEGWIAPPLNARTASPRPWRVETLTAYLRDGIAPEHAIAAGPMQQVIAGLRGAEASDLRAIAVDIVERMGVGDEERLVRSESSRRRAAEPLATAPRADDDATMRLGATVYASACAACHDAGRGASSSAALRLPLAVALYEDEPRSLLRIVRDGIAPRDGEPGRWMPGFGAVLEDRQIEALAAWLRREAAGAPPWPRLGRAVAESREWR